jgi:hypothetical protein
MQNHSNSSPPIITPPDMLHSAVDLAVRGFWVAPLCWPDNDSKCGCPKAHRGHDIGKAPLTPHGIKDSSIRVADLFNWWKRWPLANLAIDLERSGLLVVAPDSQEWLTECIRRGLPKTPLVARSGGGAGHYHFYYRQPADCRIVFRINIPDKVDIQTGGYMVAPPSLHQSGRRYRWVPYAEAVGGAQ